MKEKEHRRKPIPLELASFLPRPAFHDDLRFRVEFDGVAPLAMQDAKETFFPAAKREIGHRRGDADVDADISCGRLITEAARSGSVGGEERRLISVRTAPQ